MRKLSTRYRLACPILISVFGLMANGQSGPEITDIAGQVIAEGGTFTAINLDEVVSDPDNTDAELTWAFSNNDELLVSIEDHIAMIETPNSNWFGEEAILFTVYDPDSNTSSDEAVFGVTPVNDPPVITDIPGQAITQGGSFLDFNLDGFVSDVDDPLSALSWSVSGNINLLADIDGSHNVSVSAADVNWSGSETMTFSVIDAAGAGDSDDAVFTVNNAEDLPVANNDSYVVDEGGNLSTPAPGVLSNDSDADGDALSAVLVSSPGKAASFSMAADGSFEYTHNGSSGTDDSFTYVADDSKGQSNTATVTINIKQVNDAPVAQPDAYSVNEGAALNPVSPGVLGNDTDGDGDPITADLVSGPANSTSFTLNTDGSFNYVHNGSETTSDAFTYRAFDGTAYSNTVTVTITINPQNDPPVAVNDAYSVNEGGTINQASPGVLANDTDAESNPLTAIKLTDPVNGSLSLNSNGSFVYTHNGSETTTDQFTYRANDGSDNSPGATVNITITPQNDPPVVSDIPNQTIAEEASFATINLDGYVADPDNPDNQITWEYSGNVQLIVSISPSRVATITTPGLHWFGTETITFTAKDPSNASSSDQAIFTVNSVNDIPVLAGIESSALIYTEGDPAKQITNSITVTDVDNVITSAWVEITTNYQNDQDILAYTGVLTSNWNSSTGRLTLTGNSDPATYQNALRQVTYRNTSLNPSTLTRNVRFNVNDGIAASNIVNRNITVNSANNAPVLADPSITPVSFTEGGGAKQITNTLTVTDDDNTNLNGAEVRIVSGYQTEDVLGFNPSGSVTGLYSNGVLTLSGSAALNTYRNVLRSVTFNNTSDAPNTANRTISFTVSDGTNESNILNKTVTVTAVNDPPLLSGIEGSPLAYKEGDGKVPVTATLDVADVDNSTLTSAVITVSGNYQNGQDVLDFNDGFGLTHSWNQSNGELQLTGTATIAQMQSALRTVTFENTSKNPVTTARTIRFQVSDGSNGSNAITRNISITNANSAPVLAEPSETDVNFIENGGSVRLTNTITVTDDDVNLSSATVSITSGLVNTQDILTFTSASGVTGTYNPTSGVLSLSGNATVAAYQTALRSVRYDNTSEAPVTANRVVSFIVNDGTNPSNIITKTVTIEPANDPPVASNLTITALNNNIGTLHTANFTFTDPDGDNPGTHKWQWYRSASLSGTSPSPIPGATAATYRPVKADGGNYIGFEVTPVDEFDMEGSIVRITPFTYVNAVPVAGNPHIFAPQSIPGSNISGRFTYTDKENNPRGNALYRWYRSDVANPSPASPGTQIATDSTYRLRNSESGKWIWFRVNPVATSGSTPGDSAWSNVIGPIGDYTAVISRSDTFCQGAIMPITLTITGGKAPYEAKLHRAGLLAKDTIIADIASSPRTINVRIPGTYTLVEVKDEGGDLADISSATPVVLAVNPRPRARISGTTSICQGIETHAPLTLDFLSGVSPWEVRIRRGETSANDTIIKNITDDPATFTSRIFGDGPTRHRVVAISDAIGCPGDTTSGSAYLSYKTSPIAVISGSDSICPGETSALTVTLSSGNIPWSFTYQRNGVNAGTYSNITNTSQTVLVTQAGTYTLSVVTDPVGTGCGSGKAVIVAHTPPTASISGTATICEHTQANLTVSLTGKSPWKFGYHRNFTFDSTVVENVQNTPNLVQVRKAGTYRLYEVVDRNGCRGTVSGSAVITVTPGPHVTISGLKKAYNFTENEIDTIIGTPSGGDYAGPGVLGNFFLPRIAGLGTHNITYRYRTSPAGCYGYDTATVSVLESSAIIVFENNRTKYCKNDAPFVVTGINLDDSPGTFTISGGAGLIDNGDNTATVFPSQLNPNRYVITYKYYYGGDLFPKVAEFDVGPAPVAQFYGASECFHEGQPINFINNSSSSFGFLTDTSYFWKIRRTTGFDSDSTRDISYTFASDGIYSIELRIENSYGCSDTAISIFNLRPTIDLDERYEESFELHPISWQASSQTAVNSWTLGNPTKHEIPPRGFSGAYNDTACWYTKITRIPAPAENSWVTSPCFDFTLSDRPMLTMQIWRLFNSNRDGANIQVTADSGKTWNLVGELGDGENWFNTSNIRGVPGGKDDGWSNYDGISNDANWVRARHGLDFLKGKKDVQFRIAYGSDGTPQNNDGIAFDAFTISERTKMTLIEHFTNTGLATGEKADSVLDLFAGQYGVNALDIQYHTSNPSGDPFNEDSPMIPTTRQLYYGISTVPYAIIDGGVNSKHQIDYKSGSKPFDRNVIIRQSLSDSKFQISVDATRTGNTLNAKVRIVANETLPVMELSVRSAVVETLIEGISGSNGDTSFRNVVRAMLPDAAGNTLFKSWDLIEDFTINNSWEIENVNNINRLMVVAFIQNEATREIYNVAVDTIDLGTPVEEPLPIPAKSGFSVYPNPARQQAMIKLDQISDSDVILQLFSNTGNIVYSGHIQSGDLSAVIPVEELPDGLYVLRLMAKNKLLGIRKLIVTK